jgi:cytochrome c biogenesis protein
MARLWSFLCSLKLAIVLASAATLVIMTGSVLMPANPRLFAGMDAVPLGDWLAVAVPHAPGLTGWVPAAAVLILLLGLNTACCFLDWLLRLRSRWRKTGEYLIHLGFVLVLAGYLWGSAAGMRSEGNPVAVGGTIPVPGWAGHYLRLESLAPRLDPRGRPLEIMADLALLRGDAPVVRKTVGANAPLLYRGLVAFPASFGYAGGVPYGVLTVNRDPGSGLALAGAVSLSAGVLLALFSFYAKRRRGDRPEI